MNGQTVVKTIPPIVEVKMQLKAIPFENNVSCYGLTRCTGLHRQVTKYTAD